MRTALLFPGQGAPAGEWHGAVRDRRPELLERATGLLAGVDPFDRFGEGTEYDQPAIYCASLVAFELAGRPAAELHAGHSLGELAALACAGSFSDGDGLAVVVERGRAMAEAAAGSGAGAGAGAGGMLAVGCAAAEVEAMAARHGLGVANLNSPSQTVLAGPATAIEEAEAECREQGVRAKRLPVAGAFHSPAMAPAAEALARALERIAVRKPRVPVLTGRTGQPFDDVRAELAASLLEPVRWIDVVAALEREGIERCREIGPGKALSGLVRRTAGSSIATEPTQLPEAARA